MTAVVDPIRAAQRIEEATKRLMGGDWSRSAELDLAEALEDAIRAPSHPAIADQLELLTRDRSALFGPLAHFGAARDDPRVVKLFAKALEAHLSTPALHRAHLNVTTEVTGPSTYGLSMACLDRARREPLGPWTMSRHGSTASPWRALFSDFAHEFSEVRAQAVCKGLSELCQEPPQDWLHELAHQGALGALTGAARAVPALCAEAGFLAAIDACAAAASDYGVVDDEAELQAPVVALLEFALGHGLRPLPPGAARPKSAVAAALSAYSDFLDIKAAMGDASIPSRFGPRL